MKIRLKRFHRPKRMPLFFLHISWFFLIIVGSVCIGFSVFFYQYFYRVVAGNAIAKTERILKSEQTINLGTYQHIIERHRERMESGTAFAQKKQRVSNPFTAAVDE